MRLSVGGIEAAMPSDQRFSRINAGYFAICLLLGGAGAYYPLIQSVLELGALALLFITLPRLRGITTVPIAKGLLLLMTAWFALILLQLVPLPPAIGLDLPGRSWAIAVQREISLADSWRPLSLAPDRTARTLLASLIPAAILCGTLTLSKDGRLLLWRVVIAAALAGAIVSVVEFATGFSFSLWANSTRNAASGLFTNRTHHADMMLVGIIACGVEGAVRSGARWEKKWMLLALTALFAFAVLITKSRSGLVLLPLAVFAALFLARPAEKRGPWRYLSLGAAIGLIAMLLTPTADRVLARFASLGDNPRYGFWAMTAEAIGDTFPIGTGLGTFRSLIPVWEPLRLVNPYYPNHAHNDYLELVMEGGALAALLLAGLIAIVVRALQHHRRAGNTPGRNPIFLLGGFAVVLILALHSFNDYPLRMTALAAAGAFALSLLALPHKARTRSFKSSAAAITSAIVVLCLSALSVSFALSMRAEIRDPQKAVALQPFSSTGWISLAYARLTEDRCNEAKAAAVQALRIAPASSTALAVLGSCAWRSGDEASAERWMALAEPLGWRDIIVQSWLADQSLQGEDRAKATPHLDALLRMDPENPIAGTTMMSLLADRNGPDAVAEALGVAPSWRHDFFENYRRTGVISAAGTVTLVEGLSQSPTPVTEAERSTIRSGLQARGETAAVRRLSSGLIDNGTFSSGSGPLPNRARSSRDWRSGTAFGVNAVIGEIENPWDGNALIVSDRGIGTGTIAEQTMTLAPGLYRLRLAIRPQASVSALPEWQIACQTSPDRRAPSSPLNARYDTARDSWQSLTADFVVPERGCTTQTLQFVVADQARDPAILYLDSIEIISLPD